VAVVVALILTIAIPVGIRMNNGSNTTQPITYLYKIDSLENLKELMSLEKGICVERHGWSWEFIGEADIVETNGYYVFYACNHRNRVTIIDVSDPENLKIAAEMEYDVWEQDSFSPSENIHVNGDKLIVVGTRTIEKERNSWLREGITIEHSENAGMLIASLNELDTMLLSNTIVPITGYSWCECRSCMSWAPRTIFTAARIYNISDKENIAFEREINIEGSHLTSKMIGDNIYLIANQNIRTDRLYEHDISKLNEEAFKPQYRDTAVNDEIRTLDFSNIAYSPESILDSYLNIIGFNIKSNESVSAKSLLGAGRMVYSSENNLYITHTVVNDERTEVTTNIYKFALCSSEINFVSMIAVSGRPSSQSCMSEYNGHFRITTAQGWGEETIASSVFILNENLEIVGSIEGIELNQREATARFEGNKLYIVGSGIMPYKEVVSLFVVDLGETTNPRVLGELEIPWNGRHLNTYNENYLIGIGDSVQTTDYRMDGQYRNRNDFI